ncbi:MAG TPA: membrane bound O-acyl transferase family-domain-containing protein, partial [Thermoanaerobaculia bacterium]|nr:membrane bound O-acyl transferase family-domain-containing protein [Thermoanaerobaculia bacterium]
RLLEWATFALGWPGMQPDVFRKERIVAVPDERFRDETRRILRHGLVCAAAGSICLYVAHRLRSRSEIAVALLALVGLSLVLHFGLFDLVTSFWRSRGVPCRPPFRQPLRSTSLNEFWGKRWNVPYVEMVAAVLYRPLAGATSRPLARFASFAFSGLLHELAISLPVRAGWGGPLLYFALQGFFVLAEERSPAWKRAPAAARRVVTLLLVVLPAPLLFHLPFVRGVIEPIVGCVPPGSTTPS